MKPAIYARVSTARQEQEATVETQLMVVRDYCADQNLNAPEFVDEGWSGMTTELQDRPGGAALIAACKAKDVDAVIVYKRDRLGRDLNLGLAERLLARLKVNVISVTQPHTNAEGMVGRTARRTEQFTSGLYADYIRENTMVGRVRAVRDGKWMSSVAPFGYVYSRCTCPTTKCTDASHGLLTPHPENADVVRQMFEWAAAGEGLYAIAARLEQMGVVLPLPPGKQHITRKREWHVTTVHKMLTAKRYVGRATYAGKPMKCPALVDEATFEAVEQQLAERGKRMTGVRTTKRHYLLRRLVYCRACGGACRCKTEVSAKTGWTQAIYECRARAVYPNARAAHGGTKRRWHADVVEEAVKRFILDLLHDPEHALRQARLYEEEAAKAQAAAQHERDLLVGRIRALDAQETKVLEYGRKGTYRTEAQFEEELAKVRDERAALEVQALSPDKRTNGSRPAGISPQELEVILPVLVRRATDLLAKQALDDYTLAYGDEEWWSEQVQTFVRRVWLEPDGKTVTIDGIIPDAEAPSASAPSSLLS